MGHTLLKIEIRNKFEPTLRPYADKAFDIFFEANPDYKSRPYLDPFLSESIRRIVINLVAIAKEAEKAGKKKQAQLRPQFEYSADNLIRSERALERLQPEVENLRLELFGKTEVPFKDYASALRWVKKEAPAEAASFLERVGDQRGRVKEIDKRIEELAVERNELSESYLSGKYYWTVPLPLASGFRTFPETRLRRLALTVRDLAAISQFGENALAVYVLTGIKPIQKLIEMTFYGPVTVRNLISFYKQQAPLFKRPRKISTTNVSILEFVKARGGAPKKGKMKFWADASKAWNKTHQERRSLSLHGLKRAYERAVKKIQG